MIGRKGLRPVFAVKRLRNEMRKRLILITNIIAPYRIAVFNYLAESKDIDLRIIFLSETEGSRQWKIYKEEINLDYKILRSFRFYIQSREMPLYFNWGLWKELKKFRPDVICMCGYHYLATIEALVYSKLMHIPITLWAGSHLLSGFLKNLLTEFYKRTIIPRFDSYITYGTAAKEQIIHYGVNPEKIVIGCNTVDVELFMKKADNIKEGSLKQMKRRYPRKNILYVGNFIAHKGIFNLIKAFHKLGMDGVGLILVGDGIGKAAYLEYVREHQIKNIFFEGFIQKEDIVKYYKLADVFVLPSFNEVWGLVVNEAMACGLPIISSKLAGATRDLVKDGINGYSFDPDNIEELTEKLKTILGNNELTNKMRAESLEIIKDKTPQNYAEKILETVKYALQKK